MKRKRSITKNVEEPRVEKSINYIQIFLHIFPCAFSPPLIAWHGGENSFSTQPTKKKGRCISVCWFVWRRVVIYEPLICFCAHGPRIFECLCVKIDAHRFWFFFSPLSLSAVNDSGVPPSRLGLQQQLEETDLSPLSVATPNARGRVKERGRREGERNSTTVSRIQHTNTHACRAEFELGGKIFNYV